jgi:glycosyltransferase involved in cell wall biosynthesis
MSHAKGNMDSVLEPIELPYLIVIPIPVYTDHQGQFYAERLWRLDLEKHFEYLPNLTIACPVVDLVESDVNLEPIAIPETANIRFVHVKPATSLVNFMLGLPRFTLQCWSLVRRHNIIHSGVVGWPIPPGWVVNPIALLLGKRLLIVVESIPWREEMSSPRKLVRWRAWALEKAARFYIRRSSMAVFNQPHFRDTLCTPSRPAKTFVYPSVWLNESNILSEQQVKDDWRNKLTPLKVFFAGRVTQGKGIEVLLQALRLLDTKGVPLEFNLIGSGDLLERCRQFAGELNHVSLTIVTELKYGPEFFEFIRGHSLMVLPCLVDEQPRILFDCYSQGVPVIASDVPGLVPHVSEGETGWQYAKNDAAQLASLVEQAIGKPDQLAAMALNCRAYSKDLSIDKMHSKRHAFFVHCIADNKI